MSGNTHVKCNDSSCDCIGRNHSLKSVLRQGPTSDDAKTFTLECSDSFLFGLRVHCTCYRINICEINSLTRSLLFSSSYKVE